MRRLIFFMSTSLDGYIEGPGREIDWHHVDDEFNEFAIQQLRESEALLFGRRTYELMASYWPTPHAIETDPVVADLMNSLPKVVFSKSLKSAAWQNTRLVQGDFEEEIRRLKAKPGGKLASLGVGGSDLAVSCLKAGLLDEIRIMLNPIVLGNGKPLFKGLNQRLELKQAGLRTFRNGNILVSYLPVYK